MQFNDAREALHDVGVCTGPRSLREWEQLAAPWEEMELVATTDAFCKILDQAKTAMIREGKLPYYPRDFAAKLKEMRDTEIHMREAQLPMRPKEGRWTWAEWEDYKTYLIDTLGMWPGDYLKKHGQGALTSRTDIAQNPDELRAMRHDPEYDIDPF